MQKNITKEFEGQSWYECISKIVRFLMDYNLELVNLTIKKTKTNYIGVLEYGLNVR